MLFAVGIKNALLTTIGFGNLTERIARFCKGKFDFCPQIKGFFLNKNIFGRKNADF